MTGTIRGRIGFRFCRAATPLLLGLILLCQGQAVEILLPPGEPASATFAVDIGGEPLPVIRYEDIDVVHFPFTAPGTVRIRRLDGDAIAEHRIRPERLGYRGQAEGSVLSFGLDQPRQLVINVDRLRKLVLLAEPSAREQPSGAREVNAVDVGADPSGATDSTEALQAAINAMAPGGTLYLPPGRYVSGSLDLKSDFTLRLAFGAILKGSADPGQHRFHKSYLYFLRGQNLHDVRIVGPGIIDANGHAVRTHWQTELNQEKVAGRALLFLGIRNLEIRDVTVRDSYSWNVHIAESDHVVLDQIKVLSNMTHSNGDGLDLDGCADVIVEDCFIYAEDDAISPKASWSHRTPERYDVRRCILWSQNATGIRLGDETASPEFKDMSFSEIDILRANTMLRIYNYDGADVHRILFRDLWLEEYSMDVQGSGYEETARSHQAHEGVTSMLHIYIRPRTERSALGTVRDVTLENIHASRVRQSRLTDSPRLDGAQGIRDIVFRHCDELGRPLRTLQELRVKLGPGSGAVRVE